MKMVLMTVALLAFILFMGGCTSAESYSRADFDFSKIDKIAVIDVVGEIGGEAAKNQVSDFFVMELLKKGYSPIERAQVHTLLVEQEFQASAVTSDHDAVQAGRILNIPTVLIINVPKFNEKMNFTAKMLNVEDGSILWLGSGEGTSGKTLATIAGAAAGAVVGVAVSGHDDALVGGLAGGALGGVAGNALSPQKATSAKKIINKVCKTLPYRTAMK